MSAEDWFDLGLELEASSVEQSRDAYRRALELDPMHPEAHLHLGCLLRAGGQVAPAAEHFHLTVQTESANAEALYYLGEALEELGKDDEAIEVFRAAIASDPRCGDAYVRLSRIYERQGDREMALRLLSDYRQL